VSLSGGAEGSGDKYVRWATQMQYYTMPVFLDFCPKSILGKYQRVRNQKKNKGTIVTSTLKIDIKKCLYFVRFFTCWYLKFRFALNTFFDKNPQKQPL
jgi:hypothetical protein